MIIIVAAIDYAVLVAVARRAWSDSRLRRAQRMVGAIAALALSLPAIWVDSLIALWIAPPVGT